MIKLIAASLLFIFSTPIMAASCFSLYEAEAVRIRKEKAHSERLGASYYIQNGELAYWPGVKVSGEVDNWAQDLLYAIKWGPSNSILGGPDPRGEWLKTLSKSIKKECPLPDDQYAGIRKILSELMSDGSFCPNSQIMSPHFLKGKSAFKDVLKKAINDQRFVDICQGRSVADDSFRTIKDVKLKKSISVKKGSQKQ